MAIRKRISRAEGGVNSYQVYFSYTDYLGRPQKYNKGGFKTRKEAQIHEIRMKNEYLDFGELSVNCGKTITDVFKDYMELESCRYASATIQYYHNTHKLYIENSIGQREIFKVKYRDLQMFFNQLECGLSVAKNVKKIMNVSFKYAKRCGYIRDNPMRDVRLNIEVDEEERLKEKIISEEDFKLLCSEMLKTKKSDDGITRDEYKFMAYEVALKIGWYTGLRISEVLGLHKTDINFERRTIKINRRIEYHGVKAAELKTVNKLKTKASKSTIPLSLPLKDILEEWFKLNPYDKVITDIDGKYVTPTAFTARIRKVADKIGLNDFCFHCLRHTFTSTLVMKGVSPSIAKELVRHSNIQTTLDIYTHINKTVQTEVIDEIFTK